MSRSSGKRKKRSVRGRKGSGGSASGGLADLGSYLAFGLIWVFSGFLFYISAREAAPVLTTAMATVFFWYVVWCTGCAFSGRKLYKWQRGLVRGPLVLLGGAREPVAAIKGRSIGRNAIVVAVLIAGLMTGGLIWVVGR